MRHAIILILAASLLSAGCASHEAAASSSPAGDSFVIDGAVERPGAWDTARIEAELGDAVRIVEHEVKGGVIPLRALPLSALLEAAGIRYVEDHKNPGLAMAVVLSARDGYTVAFRHDEVIPHGEDEAPWVFLAFAEDDEPMPERYRPARLYLSKTYSGDARRMHGIDHIRVVDLAELMSR